MYNYGEEISYSFDLLKADDYDDLQLFECGNEQLDKHIRSSVIKNGIIVDEDGLYFKFTDENTGKIIAIASIAISGIIHEVGMFVQILPAIKIDVLAVDKSYQKMHYNAELEQEDEHYYFSDEILGHIIYHCKEMIENYALANYIVVYADKAAYRYYERNGFCDFSKYMKEERNMEISKNIPMYLDLNK